MVDLDYDTLMIAESTDFRKTPVDMSYPYWVNAQSKKDTPVYNHN